LAGKVYRLRKGFEETLNNMMGFTAIEQCQVKIASGFVGKPLKKFPRQTEAEGTGHILNLVRFGDPALAEGIQTLVDEERASTEVDDTSCKTFIHRYIGFSSEGVLGVKSRAVPTNAAFVTQGLGKGLAQCDAAVLHGVVRIDFQVTLALQFEVANGVFGEECEHVIQKGDTCLDSGFTSAIDGQFQLDGGFFGDTLDLRAPDQHAGS
jgi:hypothetical protein